MDNGDKEINIEPEDGQKIPVIINAENGSTVTVNIYNEVVHSHYNNSYHYDAPAWLDRSAFDALIEAIKGRG